MERHGSRKVPTAPVEERGHFFYYLWCHGIFLDPKSLVRKRDSGIRIVLISLEQLLQALYFIDAISDACCKYCCLLQSTAFTLQLCDISGCKSLVTGQFQFLTQQYIFANVLVSLEGLRSAPAQCQKRFVVLRTQSFGCSICTAPQPWSMRMPITWQCGGKPCHQLLLINMEDNRISRQWPGSPKRPRCGTASGFSQKLPGYWAAIHGPCFQRGIFNQMLLRMRAGGEGFFKFADVCSTWSG